MTSELVKALNACFSTDGYKVGHVFQYAPGTEVVINNFTARATRIPEVEEVIVGGFPMIIKYLQELWEPFFNYPNPEEIADAYAERMNSYLMTTEFDASHFIRLHKHGRLPLRISYVPEGSAVKLGTPMYTSWNLSPDTYWLPNYIETFVSAESWKLTHTATIAHHFRTLFEEYNRKTSEPDLSWFSMFQGHDFSFRGMSNAQDAERCGVMHLYSLQGSDCLPAIWNIEQNYTNATEIAYSVPATEHAVMCSMGKEQELEGYRRLLTEVYPNGLVSIVSDTWDYWQVVTEFMVELKDVIMNRQGKLVLRPDSGDPVQILLGDPTAPEGSATNRGTIDLLMEIFGYTVNSKGYKVLDSHIGVIYGDAITFERAHAILSGLEERGISSTCVVFGIGSYTYQYCTRDTFSEACKSTGAIIDNKFVPLFKDPKTDSYAGGMKKKSLKGLFQVGWSEENHRFELVQDGLEVSDSGLLEDWAQTCLPGWIHHDLSSGYVDVSPELDLQAIRQKLSDHTNHLIETSKTLKSN